MNFTDCKTTIPGVIAAPFMAPAAVMMSSKDKMPTLLMVSAVPVLVFFGLAYLLHRKYPEKQVMGKALAVWLVGVLVLLLFFKVKVIETK